MGLDDAISKLEKIKSLTKDLKVTADVPVDPVEVEFTNRLTKILRQEDKAAITIALLVSRLINKYEGRAV